MTLPVIWLCEILEVWAEHFQVVLNYPSTVNHETINWIEQTPISHSFADPPQPAKVMKAIWKLSKVNTVYQVNIVYHQEYRTPLTDTELFCEMWQQENIPLELMGASIIHLYKKKGDRQSSDNHRVISPFIHSGKNPGWSVTQ